MNTWKVIFATLAIFLAGVVTGGLVVHHSQSVPAPHRQRIAGDIKTAGGFGSAGGMRLEFLRRIQRDLDLSPEQREQIDKILKEAQERTRKIMEPVSPELRRGLQRTKEEFREVLNASQRARFDELIKRQQHPHELRRPEAASVTNSP